MSPTSLACVRNDDDATATFQEKAFTFFAVQLPSLTLVFLPISITFEMEPVSQDEEGRGGGDEDKYALATSHVPLRGIHICCLQHSRDFESSPHCQYHIHAISLPWVRNLLTPSPSVQTSYMHDHLCQSLLSLPLPIPVLSMLPIYYERSC